MNILGIWPRFSKNSKMILLDPEFATYVEDYRISMNEKVVENEKKDTSELFNIICWKKDGLVPEGETKNVKIIMSGSLQFCIFWFLRVNTRLKMHFTLVLNSTILNIPIHIIYGLVFEILYFMFCIF